MLRHVHTRALVITLALLLAGVALDLLLSADATLDVALLLAAAAVVSVMLLLKHRGE